MCTKHVCGDVQVIHSVGRFCVVCWFAVSMFDQRYPIVVRRDPEVLVCETTTSCQQVVVTKYHTLMYIRKLTYVLILNTVLFSRQLTISSNVINSIVVFTKHIRLQ